MAAVDDVLSEMALAPVRVFVVWEPVIPTDVGPPTNRALALAPDRRVAQLWDPHRSVSQEIVRSAMADPTLLSSDDGEIDESTIVWDVVAVFPPGVEWGDAFPKPSMHGFPIVDVIAPLREALYPSSAVAR